MQGFHGSSDGKKYACNEGDSGLFLGWEDPLEKGMQPTPVLLPRDPMNRGAWWATVHGVAKSQTELSSREHTQMSAGLT